MNESLKAFISQVKGKVRITKITCSRTVRGQHGDEFVAFSIGDDSVEDQSGETSQQAQHKQGLSLREGRMAAYLLAMQTDVAAFEHAVAGGLVTPAQATNAVRAIKGNYYKQMQTFWEEVNGKGNGEPTTNSGQ